MVHQAEVCHHLLRAQDGLSMKTLSVSSMPALWPLSGQEEQIRPLTSPQISSAAGRHKLSCDPFWVKYVSRNFCRNQSSPQRTSHPREVGARHHKLICSQRLYCQNVMAYLLVSQGSAPLPITHSDYVSGSGERLRAWAVRWKEMFPSDTWVIYPGPVASWVSTVNRKALFLYDS